MLSVLASSVLALIGILSGKMGGSDIHTVDMVDE